VVPLDDVPKETPVLDAVWSMKRKRRLITNEVYKHKARLNVHGGQQEQGVNVLKLIKNLYRQKQAGRVWNQHQHKNLLDLGWK
jgi:hypothetical protein